MNTLNISQESKLLSHFTDLIDISDSFDQLQQLAQIAELLYPASDPVYSVIYTHLEKVARHLRHLPEIGRLESFTLPANEVGHD